MRVYELNIDGLVGPTHHYAGLSVGNIASTSNALSVANPAAAALQGIQKMRLLFQLGLKQAVMPPQPRPNLALLRQLGFSGTPPQMVQQAKQVAPDLLSACYSASSMWTANAATIAPSTDTSDHRVHFTAANLISHLHRHQEAHYSQWLLQHIFADKQYFHHHPPLPATLMTRDEGAANHTRFCRSYGEPGIHLFVYNQAMRTSEPQALLPSRFPARQTREASEAIARSHQLDLNQVVFAQQNPDVVDQGVFHNDVIAVGNEFLFLVHEDAFVNQQEVLQTLQSKSNDGIQIIEVKRNQVSVADAVGSYLFNSQLITLPNQNMVLIAPYECNTNSATKQLIDALIASPDNPLSSVHYLDLKQSMRNGGGPACLRLRVVLNEHQLAAMHQGVLVNERLLDELEDVVRQYYRTELLVNDLDSPALIQESAQALQALNVVLKLPTGSHIS